MHRFLLLLLLLAALVPAQEVLRVIAMPTPDECAEAGQTGGVVIDEDFLGVWRRYRDKAVAQGATIIVLEITTPGGRLDTTFRILEDLEELRRAQNIRTFSYVPYDATSAGAIIALGCRELIMGVGASIGNAIPIQLKGTGSFREAPRKLMTEVLKTMDRIATAGDFDPEILRAIVDPDIELYAVFGGNNSGTRFLSAEALDREYPPNIREQQGLRVRGPFVSKSSALTIIQGSDRLTSTPGFQEAFPHKTCGSRDELPKLLGLGDRPLSDDELLRMQPPKGLGYFFGLWFGDWSFLLLVAGVAFFVMELKTPGLGVFGVMGILSLVGFFAVQQGEGMPMTFTVGMLILGFFLLLAEFVIIPGFGVAGVSGFLLIIFSIYAATVGLEGDSTSERLIPDSDNDWLTLKSWTTAFLGIAVVGTVGALTFAKTMHRIPFLSRAFVKPPVLDAAQATGVSAAGRVQVVVGARGTAETDLRPSGHAVFPQGSIDVVSEGDWIRQGSLIEVSAVDGVRVVVVPVSETGA
ncbi:MAG: hypothetical protein HRU14_09245 [Planctomycetes bacterium]|nr:hypothetical protein [Planctomycetota bacterium]